MFPSLAFFFLKWIFLGACYVDFWWWRVTAFFGLTPYSKYYKKDYRLKLLSFHVELLLKGKINALQYTECSADSYQVNLPKTKL